MPMSDVKIKPAELIHNPKRIKTLFKPIKNVIMVKDKVTVLFPERYVDTKLATIGTTVSVMSIYAIVNGSEYAVVMAPILIDLTPSLVRTVVVDDVLYKELVFEAGSVFSPNNVLVRSESLIGVLYSEYYNMANIPFFMTYEDVDKILSEASKYAGSKLGKNPLPFELLTSMIARSADDKTKSFRITRSPDNPKPDITYVGINNVYLSYNNTASKLIGGYFQAGLTSAIIKPEQTTTKVSKLLRS